MFISTDAKKGVRQNSIAIHDKIHSKSVIEGSYSIWKIY